MIILQVENSPTRVYLNRHAYFTSSKNPYRKVYFSRLAYFTSSKNTPSIWLFDTSLVFIKSKPILCVIFISTVTFILSVDKYPRHGYLIRRFYLARIWIRLFFVIYFCTFVFIIVIISVSMYDWLRIFFRYYFIYFYVYVSMRASEFEYMIKKIRKRLVERERDYQYNGEGVLQSLYKCLDIYVYLDNCQGDVYWRFIVPANALTLTYHLLFHPRFNIQIATTFYWRHSVHFLYMRSMIIITLISQCEVLPLRIMWGIRNLSHIPNTCSFPDNIFISHIDNDWFDILFYKHCVLKLIATDIVIVILFSYLFLIVLPQARQ